MNIHWLQHADFEGLGSLDALLAEGGHRVRGTRLYAGEAPPSAQAFDALIVMGGPMNIYEEAQHPWLRAEKALLRETLALNKPVLGICLGSQLLADALGARVTRNAHTEIGWLEVALSEAGQGSAAFAGFPQRFTPFHWHGDTFALPRGCQSLMASEACAHQAFAQGRAVGIQFHLEVREADARAWFAQETPAPAPYVQSPAQVLNQPQRFADNQILMRRLLANWLAL